MTTDKPEFTICHGLQFPLTAKSLEERKVTGWQSIHVNLDYAVAYIIVEGVTVGKNQLVTSRSPDDSSAFNRASLYLLQ